MAKLTKEQTKILEIILYDIERAIDYIMADNLAICNREKYASTTLHYTRQDGKVLYEVAKHSSNIVGFQQAMKNIKFLLEGTK